MVYQWLIKSKSWVCLSLVQWTSEFTRVILVYEGLLKGAWVTQSSYIVEKSMSAWVTIMKVSSLKLPEPACQQLPGRVSFPQEGYWSHSLGGKVFFYFTSFRNFLGLVCFISFLNLRSLCFPPGGTVSILRQQLPCTYRQRNGSQSKWQCESHFTLWNTPG